VSAAGEVVFSIMYAGIEGGALPEAKPAMQDGGCVVFHRYYDPDTGRYLQPDPTAMQDLTKLVQIGKGSGTPFAEGIYAYAANNPLLATDPTGLKCYWELKAFLTHYHQWVTSSNARLCETWRRCKNDRRKSCPCICECRDATLTEVTQWMDVLRDDGTCPKCTKEGTMRINPEGRRPEFDVDLGTQMDFCVCDESAGI
jgi:RHS repeat-associated protein